jgi:hypothetical protein
MSIFFIPSSDFGGNRRPSADYAHPAHGRLGVLGTSGPDPRERGRARTRAEREASMEAFHAKRRKQAEERKAKETAARTEKEQIKARAAKAWVDRDRADREAKNKAAKDQTIATLAASRERGRAERQKQAPERRVSPLDLLKQPVSTPSQSYSPTTPEVPSEYLNALEARAESRMPAAPKAEYVPAAVSQARYDNQRRAEVADIRAAVDREIASRKPAKQARVSPDQARSNALISSAFSAPAGSPAPSMQFSPEMQRARQTQEQRFAMNRDNPLVPSMPNRLASEVGDIISGLATQGPAYFNSDQYDFDRANEALGEYRRTGRDVAGQAADAIGQIPGYVERNFGDFLIDPRNNRFAPPAGLRPVQGPTMRAAPRNPLEPLYQLIEPMVEGASDPRSMYYFPGKFY